MEKLPMIAIDDKLIARVYKVDCQREDYKLMCDDISEYLTHLQNVCSPLGYSQVH